MTTSFELLAWDTAAFGLKTARIAPTVNGDDLAEVLAQLAAEQVRLAYLSLCEPDADRIRRAAELGGRLVDRKTLFAARTEALLAAPAKASVEVREHTGPVTPDLRALAIEAGRYSRFRVDEQFPRAAFERLYLEWIDRSVTHELAEVVYVAQDGAACLGMVTVGRKDGRSDIGLIAVSEAARGKGVGQALVRRAAEWAQAKQVSQSQVVTQGTNAAACRLYERAGYQVERVDSLFHFWIPVGAR